MLNLQLQLGSFFDTASMIGFGLALPILIVLIVLLCIKWTRKIFKWAGICVLAIYVGGYFCDLVFQGGSYDAAQLLNVYVPYTVHHIENKHDGAMDENEEYIVLQFSDSQMKDLVSQLEAQGTWKNGQVVPNSLIHGVFANITANQGDPRTSFTDQSKAPLSNTKTDCLYFTSTTKRNGQGDFYVTRKVFVLDKQAKTLYLYFDDAQWG